MNEEALKTKTQEYFSSKKYWEHIIPKLHFDVIDDISDELNVQIVYDLDRNYKHSTDFKFIINPEFGYLAATYNFFETEKEILKKTKSNEHWNVICKLSLIDNVSTYFLNNRKNINGEIVISECKVSDLPEQIKEMLSVSLKLIESKNFKLLQMDFLMTEKRNWVNDIFKFSPDYNPNLYDLLFGGLDFYNEANI